MLLIVSNSNDFTADFLEGEIRKQGLPLVRFDTDTFPVSTSILLRNSGDVSENSIVLDSGQKVPLGDITSVWWRRPERIGEKVLEKIKDERVRKFTRYQMESTFEELSAVLGDELCWVNHPDKNRFANSKLVQLRIAAQQGFKTPNTILSNDPMEVQDFFVRNAGNVVYKTIKRPAFIFGDQMVGFYTSPVSAEDVSQSKSIRIAPVFLQETIKKKLELRVTVVGQHVVAASIDSQSAKEGLVDWRRLSTEVGQWSPFTLDSVTEKKCLELTRELGLRFGAIDLAITPQDEIVFFEINPNGQWAWLEIGSGIPISKFFIELFYGR